IKDMSQKYGLPLAEMTQGFKTFQGAMMGTEFESDQVRKMFGQVSKGVVAMGLTADDASGVFLALGQMMSKGKVTAEEL
ncbi:tape measure protein, partial [Streptomyces caeruleatus]